MLTRRTLLSQISVILVISCVAPPAVHAQQGDGFTPAFEAVSIKPSAPNQMQMYGMSPTGFESRGVTLINVVMWAYFPQSFRYWTMDRLQNVPAWMKNDKYDVTAKLDAATFEHWKGLNPKERQEKMAPLLQKMLAERCGLSAHIAPAEVQGYLLVVGKHGAKLEPSKPNMTTPEGRVMPLQEGGWRIVEITENRRFKSLKLTNVTMSELAEQLMSSQESPIVDQTGLNGRYDMDIPYGDLGTPDMAPPTVWDIETVGLALKAGKVPTVNVVIDHIEPPKPN